MYYESLMQMSQQMLERLTQTTRKEANAKETVGLAASDSKANEATVDVKLTEELKAQTQTVEVQPQITSSLGGDEDTDKDKGSAPPALASSSTSPHDDMGLTAVPKVGNKMKSRPVPPKEPPPKTPAPRALMIDASKEACTVSWPTAEAFDSSKGDASKSSWEDNAWSGDGWQTNKSKGGEWKATDDDYDWKEPDQDQNRRQYGGTHCKSEWVKIKGSWENVGPREHVARVADQEASEKHNRKCKKDMSRQDRGSEKKKKRSVQPKKMPKPQAQLDLEACK